MPPGLPVELWREIILYLTPKEAISLAATCHDSYAILIDDIYYKHIHSGTRSWTGFWWGVQNKQHRTVERALAQGVDPNRHRPIEIDGFPRTLALMMAIDNDDGDMVQLLLTYGADPLIIASHQSSIRLAIVLGKTDLLRIMLEHGTRDNTLENRQASSFLLPPRAVCRGGGPSLSDTRDRHGDTLLHCAALLGQVKIVQLLLEFHARIDALNSSGNTPLMVAIEWARLDIVELLLREGANPALTASPRSHDSVNKAVECLKQDDRREQILATVAKARYGSTDQGSWFFMNEGQLHNVIMGTRARQFGVLSKLGAELDSRSVKGVTPLWIKAGASREHHLDLQHDIRSLCDCGAKLDFRAPGTLMTPLMRAAEAGNPTAIDILIASGAELGARDAKGMTALSHAAVHGHYQAVFHLLLNEHFYPGDVPLVNKDAQSERLSGDIEDEHGALYVDYATSERDQNSRNGQESIYREAVKRRAKVQVDEALQAVLADLSIESVSSLTQRDDLGQTPLMLAVRGGHFDTVKIMIHRGVLDLDDGQGHDALALALEGGEFNSRLVRLLEKGLAGRLTR